MAVRFQELQVAGLFEPLALASADFDEDGVPDLVCGFATDSGGILSVHRGNIDSIFPNGEGARKRQLAGTFTEDPFLSPARVFALPVAPEFLGAGDFDADGHWDLALAKKGSDKLWFLPGNGRGDFQASEAIDLPGTVTALLAGEVNRRDGLQDLIVGIQAGEGPKVLVFEWPEGALRRKPEGLPLPAEATGFALGYFDEHYPVDLAIAAGEELLLVHGRDRKLSVAERWRSQVAPARVDRYTFERSISSLVAGDFVEDHSQELAVLLEGGSLRLLEQIENSLQVKSDWTLGLVLPSQSILAGPGNLSYSSKPQLVRARVSSLPKDELLVVDALAQKIHVLVTDNGSGDGSSRTHLANSWSVALDVAGTPVAVLPMRLNPDALSDLVVLKDSANPLGVVPTGPVRTFTVNSTGDELDADLGDDACDVDLETAGQQCTLWAALQQARSSEGLDRIDFEVSKISPAEGFPSGGPVVIDGTSMGRVEIDGSGANHGFSIVDAGSVIRGLAIHSLTFSAIQIQRGGNSFVEGNFLGTDVTGTQNRGNGNWGIVIGFSAPKNTIGGTMEEARNVISGNENPGVFIQSDENKVLGNFIGTDVTGTVALGNSHGVDIKRESNNEIGGATAGAGNLISGNGSRGVVVTEGAECTLIQGNLVGTDITGGVALANSQDGLLLSETSGTTIGGAAANLISANGSNGISISRSTGTVVQGNLIGTDINGSVGLGNHFTGIGIGRISSDNTIGGTTSGAGNTICANGFGGGNAGVSISGQDTSGNPVLGNRIGIGDKGNALPNDGPGVRISRVSDNPIQRNTIAFNRSGGILVVGGTGNAINENSIFSNTGDRFGEGLGIDLAPFGVTENDGGDGDEGPNNLQNYPVLTKIEDNIKVTLDSTPSKTFKIELFANDECDPSGHGEGQEFLQSFSLTTGESIEVAVPVGKEITATATDSDGNTSEFSACAAEPEIKPFIVNSTGDDPDENAEKGDFDRICSTGKRLSKPEEKCNPTKKGDCECTLRAAIQEANDQKGKDSIHFAISGDNPHTILPQTPLPFIGDPVRLDAATQPGYVDKPVIELNGRENGGPHIFNNGLDVRADSFVRGFAINSFNEGINLGSENSEIRGNFIGTCLSGDGNLCPAGPDFFEASLNDTGIWIESGASSRNTIGGERPLGKGCVDPCNLISGNGTGIFVLAGGNFVRGNFIGTNLSGTSKLGNKIGVSLRLIAENNKIGGRSRGLGNLISGNTIGISVSDADENVIEGNLIGTDVTGRVDLDDRFQIVITMRLYLA